VNCKSGNNRKARQHSETSLTSVKRCFSAQFSISGFFSSLHYGPLNAPNENVMYAHKHFVQRTICS